MSCIMKIIKLLFTSPCVQFFSNYHNSNEYQTCDVLVYHFNRTCVGIGYAIIGTHQILWTREHVTPYTANTTGEIQTWRPVLLCI